MARQVDFLVCPACHRSALVIEDERSARCAGCSTPFPVSEGVVDLLRDPPAGPPRAQRTMEWPWLVRIYESRLWRRGPIDSAIVGCTFAEEESIVLRALALRPDARALDLACGPGIFTRPMARAAAAGEIVGLDVSWPMLAYAGDRAREESVRNVTWVHASAFELPIADTSLDAVNCCGALHLFAELQRVLGEVRRVLKPGGRFVGGTGRRVEGRLGDLQRRLWLRAGVAQRSTPELRSALEQAGLGAVQVHHTTRFWQIVSAVRPPEARVAAAA